MAGAVRSAASGTVFVLVILGFLFPGASGALLPAAAPATGPAPDVLTPALPESPNAIVKAEKPLPSEQQAALYRHLADEAGGATVPTPDSMPGFARLSSLEQGVAWEAWLGRVLEDHALRPPWASPAPTWYDQAPTSSGVTSEMFGLRSLWRVEGHGTPRFLLPANEEGATFLVTSQAVMRYEAPGAAASWLVKPQGSLNGARVADANGDGVLDVVVGMFGAFGSDWETVPSLAVVEGATGRILFQGLSGAERFMVWDLTDVDGDGALELVGVDYQNRAVARKLDGTLVYSQPMRDVPDVAVPDPADVYLMFRYGQAGLVDVNGDGVLDIARVFRHDADAYLPLAGTDAQIEYLGVYDGRSGLEIWLAPFDVVQSFSSSSVFGGGDLDGDGLNDVAVVRFGTISGTSSGVGPLYTRRSTYISSLLVLNAVDGSPLLRDQERTMSYQVGPAPPLDIPVGELSYYPVAVADLDGDGMVEILSMEGDEETEMELVARGPGQLKGGPSQIRFRVPFEIPEYDSTDGEFILRDVDGDGTQGLVVALTGIMLDESDQPTQMESRLLTFKGQGVASKVLPRLIGLWDYDTVNGQAYGWTLEDDRWTALDREGNPTGNSTRVLVSPYPLGKLDVTDDGVPDLLFRKSMGVMWADGSTGELLQDVPRPAGRTSYWAFEVNGRLQLLEYAFGSRSYYLTDLGDGSQVWRLTPEQREGGYLFGRADFTGDGIIDVGLLDFRVDGEPYWIRDMARDEVVFRIETVDTLFPTVFDADPARPGHELFLEYWRAEGPIRLAAYNVAQEEPLWTLPTSAGRYVSVAGANAGYVVLDVSLDDDVNIQVVHASNGTAVAEWAVGESRYVRSAHFERVSGAAIPELVVVLRDYGGPIDRNLLRVQPLAPDKDGFEIELEPGYWSHLFSPPSVGDWDGDGWSDLLVVENDRPTVRGGKDGKLLASGPNGGSVAMTYDPNLDGRLEFVILDATDRLRLFTQASGANATVDDDVFRVIDDPDRALVDEGAEEFFSDVKGKSASPGAWAALVALAGALVVVRRRR